MRVVRGYGASVAIDQQAWGRMFTAWVSTVELVKENPVWRDASVQYEAARAWPLITAAYSGIEQALKMLLMHPDDPQITLDELRSRYGHDLEKLYADLRAEDRAHIELHYKEHMSLTALDRSWEWDFPTAESFLSNLNRSDQQQGSLAWRYLLLDMKVDIPKVSLWTMCEIWSAACCHIKDLQGERGLGCERLSERLSHRLHQITNSVRERPEFNSETSTDGLNQWFRRAGRDTLATYVHLLVSAERDTISGLPAPTHVRPLLAEIADAAVRELSSDSAYPDERLLIALVGRADRRLLWDQNASEFKWSQD